MAAAAVAAQQPPAGEGSYTFAAQPRPVQPQRQKYRDVPEEPPKPRNIMHDPRVVRGSTYAVNILPLSAEPDPTELQRQAEARRRARLRRKQAAMQRPPRTPSPVEGRVHADVQTEVYLEVITDRVIESDMSVQTDQFLDRPPSPLYAPRILGVDAETQVYEGDLFDFDYEVEPILEVIVGKTLEQSLIEVLEEEELENMRQHQLEFQQKRDAELAETQRLEEAERRRFEEKERRLAQERARVAAEAEAREKVAARAFAQHYLSDLMGSVFTSLNDTGFFFDTVERDVETGFMPWLMEEVAGKVTTMATARALTDAVLANAINLRVDEFGSHRANVAAEAARAALEAEARLQAEIEAERKREEEEAARLEAEHEGEESDDGSQTHSYSGSSSYAN